VSISDGRWAAYARGRRPAGGRRLSAAIFVLIALGLGGWGLTHPNGGCSCGPTISFGGDQPGFHRIDGPLARAMSHLPGHVRLSSAVGKPIGVYRDRHTALVLYGSRSRYGIFRFTAAPQPSGLGPATVRDLASECDVCAENRLVLLAPGVHGALLAGGNGPNSVTSGERVVPGTASPLGRAVSVIWLS
jgi:hypothetical protein